MCSVTLIVRIASMACGFIAILLLVALQGNLLELQSDFKLAYFWSLVLLLIISITLFVLNSLVVHANRFLKLIDIVFHVIAMVILLVLSGAIMVTVDLKLYGAENSITSSPGRYYSSSSPSSLNDNQPTPSYNLNNDSLTAFKNDSLTAFKNDSGINNSGSKRNNNGNYFETLGASVSFAFFYGLLCGVLVGLLGGMIPITNTIIGNSNLELVS